MQKPIGSDAELVSRVVAYIEANIEHSPTLNDIGAHVHMSPFHLQRVFKRVMGITPRQYADAVRLQAFKTHLRTGANVTDALYEAGYGSSSRLYERSSAQLGMTPATYGRGGEGMHIEYTIVNSPLGRLLVGMTQRGICAVYLGDSQSPDCDAELEETLFREYPLATFSHNCEYMCDWVQQILAHLNGAPLPPDLPLDLRATAFQMRVWDELRRIPYGETRTYGQIAEQIGRPKAAGAVAEAVRANPVTIVIPCHRAECKDGEPMKGYSRRGKVARKLLLSHEQQQAVPPPTAETIGAN